MEHIKTDSNNQVIDPLEVLIRMKRLGKNQNYFASVHNRYPSQITQALQGKQPGLLKKMISHIEKLETKQHGVA